MFGSGNVDVQNTFANLFVSGDSLNVFSQTANILTGAVLAVTDEDYAHIQVRLHLFYQLLFI